MQESTICNLKDWSVNHTLHIDISGSPNSSVLNFSFIQLHQGRPAPVLKIWADPLNVVCGGV